MIHAIFADVLAIVATEVLGPDGSFLWEFLPQLHTNTAKKKRVVNNAKSAVSIVS